MYSIHKYLCVYNIISLAQIFDLSAIFMNVGTYSKVRIYCVVVVVARKLQFKLFYNNYNHSRMRTNKLKVKCTKMLTLECIGIISFKKKGNENIFI